MTTRPQFASPASVPSAIRATHACRKDTLDRTLQALLGAGRDVAAVLLSRPHAFIPPDGDDPASRISPIAEAGCAEGKIRVKLKRLEVKEIYGSLMIWH